MALVLNLGATVANRRAAPPTRWFSRLDGSQELSSPRVNDATGTTFRCRPYRRIVSLVPSLTQTLFDLGLGDRIVGVTEYCVLPQEAQDSPRELVGGTKNPDVAKIRSLEPDLVVVNQEENSLKKVRQIQRFAPTFVTYPRTVEGAVEMMQDLASLTQVGEEAVKAVLGPVRRLVNELVVNPSPHPKCYYTPVWRSPWVTFNDQTYAADFLTLVGGWNLFGSATASYPRITLDEVPKDQLDVILLPDEPYHFTQVDVVDLREEGFGDVPIQLVDGKFHWYSPTQLLKLLPTFTKLFQNLSG